MKKLRLDLDALAVDSFNTALPPGGRGTVRGAEPTDVGCGTYDGTCYNTCGGPAYPTNGNTCYYLSCGEENTCGTLC